MRLHWFQHFPIDMQRERGLVTWSTDTYAQGVINPLVC